MKIVEFAARVRSLWRGARRRTHIESDMSEEFRLHVELRAADLVRSGLSRTEALRRARAEFGSTERYKAEGRVARGLHRLDQAAFTWLDIKLGVRMLRKHPALTVVTVLALAIGIPTGLAPIHLARATMASLPVEDGERIQGLRYIDLKTRDVETPILQDYRDWNGALTSFEGLGVASTRTYNVAEANQAGTRVEGAEVSASTFPVLRVKPLMGRPLTIEDEVAGAPAVVVIGHDLWRTRFAGADVVGHTIHIGDAPHTIVGVMPEGFLFPKRSQVWVPLRADAPAAPWARIKPQLLFGRLADGFDAREAEAELGTVVSRSRAQAAGSATLLRPEVVSFSAAFFDFPKGGIMAEEGMYLLRIFTLLTLLVACVNVATLIMARTSTRLSEIAVRTALGASRPRIVTQLFAEAVVLSVIAAGIGLFIADRFFVPYFETELWGSNRPYFVSLHFTAATVLTGLSLAVLSAGIVGVIPALKATGRSVQRSIQRASAARSGTRFGGLPGALIALDVAVAVIMVTLAVGTWEGSRLSRVNRAALALPDEQFLTADILLAQDGPGPDTGAAAQIVFRKRLADFQHELTQRLSADPRVRGVAVADNLPHEFHGDRYYELDVETDGATRPAVNASEATVDVDYFKGMGQPILAGRGFDARDLGEERSTVLVNTMFVERMFGGRNPVGRRIRLRAGGGEEEGPWLEIVGVVPRLGMNDAGKDDDQGIYHPAAPGEIYPFRIAIHLTVDPNGFAPQLRTFANEVDANALVADARPLSEVEDDNAMGMAKAGMIAGLLTLVLLGLAASAVYAILSLAVSLRTREIGIRTALGAQRNRIVLQIARRSLLQIGAGVVIGTPLSYIMLRSFKENRGWDLLGSPLLLAFLIGLCLMATVGALGCTVPLRRALRIMPTEALREG